uniref:AAA family ATPase n=1 Tax=uncultured Micrococcus sp. TaxID=114051 RepID=UPI00260A3573|nr:AAA family ATPase [uncultured Micrococcus sp.]
MARDDAPDTRAWDRPVRRVTEHPLSPADRTVWPADIPAVRHLLDHGLDLGDATVIVGANGAGKSTVVEAIAEAFGLNAEGGTRNVFHETRRTSSDLAEHLQLARGAGAPRGGVFLRAESMYGLFTYLESTIPGSTLHLRSHGEAFLQFCEERAGVRGLWILDEPESALSFESCLALLVHLRIMVEAGSQVVLSTHSPVLAALPGARILLLDEDGITPTAYDDLPFVRHHRAFLASPERYLRPLC